jgi:hypothetical protein
MRISNNCSRKYGDIIKKYGDIYMHINNSYQKNVNMANG